MMDDEQDLLRRLAALPREAEPDRDLWPGIAARLTAPVPIARPGRARWLVQAAAAVLLFAGGVAVGRHWEARPALPSQAQRDPLAPAVEVQRTGTAYVAALRSLAEAPGSPGIRAQGREAALSVLYGAAHELVRISPEDPGATQILKTVSTTRSATVRAVRF
jgi:hypothetical protein